ncbi:MAG: flap endonuclease-1 [Thermofilum sp. ex4484_82]|nr:MAG: flap endonuclease-1 [Thermofilum sp. ex4484_82]OYT37376.1 MAG: flap endonuclease-1 [Archaeoglobales archaeon ex4484_92]
MGVNLRELVEKVKKQINLKDLNKKVVAIDAYNMLYQFLAIIRQPDGTPLMNRRGEVTSHLSGLFYRTINLLENGIKPVYVFDGKPPELKTVVLEKRLQIKVEAEKRYREALARGDLEEARIYAQQTARLSKEMVDNAKTLLDYMGVPWVQAPSEGEAQSAYMTLKGDAWASASQDYDSLLFGSKRLIRNLAITGRRKLPRKNVYIEITPELILLDEILKEHEINREQLIDIAILIGTDYNPEGVKGIGVKRALKLVKTYGNIERIREILGKEALPENVDQIKKIFLNPEVTDDYKLKWSMPDKEAIIRFLCYEHDFSRERVEKAVERAEKSLKIFSSQTSLESWFS